MPSPDNRDITMQPTSCAAPLSVRSVGPPRLISSAGGSSRRSMAGEHAKRQEKNGRHGWPRDGLPFEHETGLACQAYR